MKKFSVIDYVIIAVVALVIVGVLAVKTHFHVTSANAIKDVSNVEFDVTFQSVRLTSKEDPIKAEKETFLTIRNVPYKKLEIVNIEKTRSQVVVFDGVKTVKSVDDPSAPLLYDYIVTVKDKATITDDGAVIGGNKIKIGLPVILEGVKYRLNGVVSDVRVVD
jgi:hypothetical protein